MEEYRKLAQQRYYEKQKKDEVLAQQEKEKQQMEEAIQREQEQKQQEERLLYEQDMDQLIMECDALLLEFPVPIESIRALILHLEEMNAMHRFDDRKEEIQDRTMRLVEWINLQQESIPSSAEQVRELGGIMKRLIDYSELDIDIDLMDTSRDEDIARQWNQHQPEPFIDIGLGQHLFPPVEEDIHLPLCSFRKRIGLTLLELRELAKHHHIPHTGSKEQLCIRLAAHGMVSIIE